MNLPSRQDCGTFSLTPSEGERAGVRGPSPGLSLQLERKNQQALSIIEFIGVLAVLSLLASALAPVVIRRVDRAAWTKEVNDMSAISNALVLQVLRGNTVPNEAGWAGTVANWTLRPTSQISTNNRRYPRLFFYDSGGWMTNAAYTQGIAGTGAKVPANARIAIVSTVSKALPYSNGSLSTANFNSLWNAAQSTTPSYFTNWTGNPYDLVIQRVSLDSLFHHLILSTRDVSGAGYSINSTSTYTNVPINAAGLNTYYLDGTVVGLWVGGTLTNRFVLDRDMSFTFESGSWRDQITGSGTDGTSTAQSFANQAAIFISTSAIAGQHQGADTQGTLSAFYAFMFAYTLWANKCPHFQYIGTDNQDADYQILNAIGKPGSGIIDGATGTGSGGLLQ